MGEEWEQDPRKNSGQPDQDNIDKRIEDIRRRVTEGAGEAQVRLKRIFNKASDYWQNTGQSLSPTPHQPGTVEEQRLRQLVNNWSNENWRIARELGSYMDIVSSASDEVWELTIETRWETRSMEVASEPYAGTAMSVPGPILPVWDYSLPAVTGLKAPQSRVRLPGMDEVVACTGCNGTGRVLCANCTGRGWIVCPDCKGRTKKRCANCRGRGYIADGAPKAEKKGFIKRRTEGVTNSITSKVSDVFDGIRQQGVPIPNPMDADPAGKGPTIPCPECINGEVDCSCRNGKRICATCEGTKTSLCNGCNGTSKLVRHREIIRRFDLRNQTHFLGDCPIPPSQLLKANGDLIFSAEIDETFHAEAPPERVPIDIWRSAVELARVESHVAEQPGIDTQSRPRPTLQVIELSRVPYISIEYRYADQNYLLYIYDGEGKEKFYADQYPARWDRVERLFRAISTDLTSSDASETAQSEPPPSPGLSPNQQPPSTGSRGSNIYRVPVDTPPYSADDTNEPGPPPANTEQDKDAPPPPTP